MFDWFKKKPAPPPKPPAPAADAAPGPAPIGRWVWMHLPALPGRFLGFVYYDAQAGLSARGGPENDPELVDRPGHTVRLPMGPMQPLTAEELSARKLPAAPPWLQHYGPQPDPEAPWRKDPSVMGLLHPSHPDDLQVYVHDGEPRRTKLAGELCWVRLSGTEPGPRRHFTRNDKATEPDEATFNAKYGSPGPVYVGRLLNAPFKLQTVKQGETLRVVAGTGLRYPLQVTPQYLEERGKWTITPCNKCGAGECLDPPSVMVRTRFPEQPPGVEMQAFTAQCICGGGMQMLTRIP